jgi:hypothetical protein
MAKQKITLTVDSELVEPMKVLAVMEKRSVSAITEVLYREYLDRFKGFAKSIEKGKQKLET